MDSTELDTVRQLDSAALGSVKVRQLDRLVFEDIDVRGSRALNQSRVKNIIHRFNHEGCRRQDPLTWIPCEVRKPVLESLLQIGFRNLRLDRPIDLELLGGSELLCLQGQHRITAAIEWLAPNDLWWNLIVYDSEKLNDECRKRLREAQNGSQIFSDGEIFQNIRHYQLRGEEKPAQEWLAKWSPTKCQDFNRIYSPKISKDERKILANRLDALLAFPALWIHWLMGTHLTSLNCPEELSTYLRKIYSAWETLTCGSSQVLDPSTLELLHGRCPRLSFNDRRFIRQIFENNLAFPRVNDPTSRSQLLQASLNYPEIIPSLHLFLENIKYLKPMTDVLKKALPSKFKGTIRQTMLRNFVPTPTSRTQVSENDFEEGRCSSQKELFWSAYRQCFLFAMRHFFGLTDIHPRGYNQSSKSHIKLECLDLWQRLKFLLNHLGFASDGAQNIRAPLKPEYVAIQKLLSRLRPPELFEYDHTILTECSNHIAAVLEQIKPRLISTPRPLQSTDATQNWTLMHRCGMTFTDTFFSDRKYLFLQNVYAPDDEPRESITSFAVKRDIFKSFFPDESTETAAISQENIHNGGLHSDVLYPDSIQHQDIVMKDTTVTRGIENYGDIPQAICLPEHQDTGMHNLVSVNTAQPTENSVVLGSSQVAAYVQSRPIASLENTANYSTTALSIISQSPAACKCTTDMSADRFWASCKHLLSDLPYIIFFGVSQNEVLLLHRSNVHEVINIAPEVGSGWCATPMELPRQNSPALKTLAKSELLFQATKRGMIFYGDTTDLSFRSFLKPCTDVAAITLPFFDTSDEVWKNQE